MLYKWYILVSLKLCISVYQTARCSPYSKQIMTFTSKDNSGAVLVLFPDSSDFLAFSSIFHMVRLPFLLDSLDIPSSLECTVIIHVLQF